MWSSPPAQPFVNQSALDKGTPTKPTLNFSHSSHSFRGRGATHPSRWGVLSLMLWPGCKVYGSNVFFGPFNVRSIARLSGHTHTRTRPHKHRVFLSLTGACVRAQHTHRLVGNMVCVRATGCPASQAARAYHFVRPSLCNRARW